MDNGFGFASPRTLFGGGLLPFGGGLLPFGGGLLLFGGGLLLFGGGLLLFGEETPAFAEGKPAFISEGKGPAKPCPRPFPARARRPEQGNHALSQVGRAERRGFLELRSRGRSPGDLPMMV
jgi:hypothetical protein